MHRSNSSGFTFDEVDIDIDVIPQQPHTSLTTLPRHIALYYIAPQSDLKLQIKRTS